MSDVLVNICLDMHLFLEINAYSRASRVPRKDAIFKKKKPAAGLSHLNLAHTKLGAAKKVSRFKRCFHRAANNKSKQNALLQVNHTQEVVVCTSRYVALGRSSTMD